MTTQYTDYNFEETLKAVAEGDRHAATTLTLDVHPRLVEFAKYRGAEDPVDLVKTVLVDALRCGGRFNGSREDFCTTIEWVLDAMIVEESGGVNASTLAPRDRKVEILLDAEPSDTFVRGSYTGANSQPATTSPERTEVVPAASSPATEAISQVEVPAADSPATEPISQVATSTPDSPATEPISQVEVPAADSPATEPISQVEVPVADSPITDSPAKEMVPPVGLDALADQTPAVAKKASDKTEVPAPNPYESLVDERLQAEHAARSASPRPQSFDKPLFENPSDNSLSSDAVAREKRLPWSRRLLLLVGALALVVPVAALFLGA